MGRQSKLVRSEYELRELVARQATSGLTIAEFCHKHSLTLHHFRRIRELDRVRPPSSTFIKARARASARASCVLVRGKS